MVGIAEGFHTPAAVKFDHQGRLYVIDQEAAEVIRVDVATGTKETVATLEIGIDNLTFDTDYHLFVSSAGMSSLRLMGFPSGDQLIVGWTRSAVCNDDICNEARIARYASF